jgi:Flp pilus assembly protein TadG
MSLIRAERPTEFCSRFKGERGATLVEFAVCLPLLAMVVFGVVDLGRAYSVTTSLHNAARQGATFAQYSPYSVSARCAGGSIVDSIRAEDTSLNIQASEVVVTLTTSGGTTTTLSGCNPATKPNPLDTVTVTVSRSMPLLTPLVSAVVGNVNLVGKAEVVVQK